MLLADFLQQLESDGELEFRSNEPAPMDPQAEAEAIRQLLAMDERRRLEMAHEPPPFRTEPALWAARLIYRVCQFQICREISAERIQVDLSEPCPGESGPAQAYSVDLTFHWLPHLLIRAANIASADPLITELQRLAWEWPLSSVGIGLDTSETSQEPDLSPILAQKSLRQLYVDRIFKSRDQTRLHHPEIQKACQNAAGLFPELAGLSVENPR